MKIDSFIFDMDGTLWDSREGVVAAWNEAFEECGVPERITVEKLSSLMGLPMDLLGESIFEGKKYSEVEYIFEKCYKKENDYLREHGGILYPALKETLEKLHKKHRLFIVSNCQSGYIEAFLEHYQLGYLFEDIECYGNNELQKGENIALIVKRNKLKHPVYVGDIQKDADASKEAGVPFIFAEYGFGDVEKYDGIIHTFKDLLEIGENK